MPRQLPLLSVLALLLVTSQLPTLATGSRPATIHQATPTPSWQRIDTGPFSVALPPGWTYEPKQGRDSFVGAFVGPDMQLHFDYGRYWNTRPADGAPGYEVLHEDVDFRPAEIWLARTDPAEVTALFVDYVVDPDPARAWMSPTRLSLLGLRLRPDQQNLALAILRTVRFRRVIPEQGRWEVAAELPKTALLDLEVLNDGTVRVAGGYYVTGMVPPVGVVYDLRGGVWQRQVISDTKLIAGVSGNWAVENPGHNILRRDTDGEWRTSVSEPSGVLFDLQDVGAEVWAVGLSSLLMHFDGNTWTTLPDVGGGTSIDLVSQDEGWVAGARNLMIRRTGGNWRTEPWPGPEEASIQGVDAVSPREAWFAGGLDTDSALGPGGLLHWRDGGWHYVGDLVPHTLWGVDLASPAEGWAVGGRIAGNEACEIVRFQNGAWHEQADACSGFLRAVESAPDGTTWAVGYQRTAEGVFTGLVMRYAALPVTPTATDTPTIPPSPTHTATPSPSATAAPTQPRMFLPMARKKG